MAGEEAALALAREEAEVLTLGASGDRDPGVGGDPPHLALAQSAEREAQPAEQRRRQRGEHVALVLAVVGRRREQRPMAVIDQPRVVPGRESGGAEPLGDRDHRLEPDLAVAAHAGVRRPARGVAGKERRDDARAEAIAQVDGQVRDPERVGDRARQAHRLRRAAALLAVVGRVGPELERHGEDLRPTIELRRQATALSTPPLIATSTRSRPACGRREQRLTAERGGPQRPVQGIGGELGAVAADRAQPAELGLDLGGREQRRLGQRRAVDQLGGRGERGAGGGAALGFDPRIGQAADVEPEGDPQPIAAGRAAGGARVAAVEWLAEVRAVAAVVVQCLVHLSVAHLTGGSDPAPAARPGTASAGSA